MAVYATTLTTGATTADTGALEDWLAGASKDMLHHGTSRKQFAPCVFLLHLLLSSEGINEFVPGTCYQVSETRLANPQTPSTTIDCIAWAMLHTIPYPRAGPGLVPSQQRSHTRTLATLDGRGSSEK